MFSLDNLRTADLQIKLQYAFTFGMINGDDTQDFIDSIRARERIEPPANKRDLRYNLKHYRCKDYQPEALDFARECVVPPDPTPADLGMVELAAVPELLKTQPVMLTPPGFLESLANPIVFPADFPQRVAKVLARHIVTGYMEIPKPIPIRFGFVHGQEQDGSPVVIAVVFPGTDLNQLVRELRLECRRAFGHGPRYRGPDDIIETGWLRAYSKHLERLARRKHDQQAQDKPTRPTKAEREAPREDEPTQEEDLRRDLATIEFSFELWPEARPQHAEGSTEYEHELRRQAKNFRTNASNFEAWLDRMMPDETPAKISAP